MDCYEMIIQKIIYLIIAVTMGFIFYALNVPAGWLIGALITGIVCGIFIKRYEFEGISFKIGLSFVGANISLLLMVDTLKKIHHFFLPLLITIIVTITAGFLFGILLYKKTNEVDKITAFFCCIPGGASEIIGISGQYGADDRLVAAFHTVRITFFTIAIPLIVGYLHPNPKEEAVKEVAFAIDLEQIVFFSLVMILTIILDRTFKVPGGTLLFSILIGFILSEFVIDVGSVPRYIAGIGQAAIGAFVGIRFDIDVLNRLLKVGPVTIMIIASFFALTLITTTIFMLLTSQPYATSLISTVPAGAAEMSVTAVALDVNPTIVASLHIVRVVSLFLMLPFLLKLFGSMNEKYKKLER